MMAKTDYNKSMNAWANGEEIKDESWCSGSWKLSVPDELELDAAEIKAARPWHSMTLAEQMESMTVDVKKQAWYVEAI